MSQPNEPLKVDPTELHMTADKIEGHASEFLRTHQAAQSRAENAALGSGAAAAALPGMLAAWEADGVRFSENFAKHARAHREAANSYERTDADGADAIGNSGSAL